MWPLWTFLDRHTHENQEKCKARVESRHQYSSRISWIALIGCCHCRICHIGSIGVVPRDKCCSIGTPEGTFQAFSQPPVELTSSRNIGSPVLCLPKVPNTTKGKVLPMIHSPTAPSIIKRQPKKKNTPWVMSVWKVAQLRHERA